MSDTMSERQFAKHTGRALSTVQEARTSGRLQRSVSKDAKGRIRIDPVLAAEEWAENTRERVTDDAAGDGDSVASWRAARARREAALATLAEDEVRRTRGELVEVKGVKAAWVTLIVNSRNKLLGIPTRMKQRLPHLSRQDVTVIDDLITEALEDLAGSAGEQPSDEG